MMRARRAEATALALCLGLGGLAVMGVVRSQPAFAAGARICLEVEVGKVTDPVVVYKSKDCSGGAGIEVPEGANPKAEEGKPPPKLTGDCTITFKAPQEGTYSLWARAWWIDGCGNSYAVSVDDGDRATISSGNYKRWHWVRGPKLRLSAGKHTLVLHNTEDGARLDQIFLTTDAARVPVGKEKATPEALVK